MEHYLPVKELIDFAKPYLKEKGFKKKNNRWTKDIGEFTLSFLIQGSRFGPDYYVRPGIFINQYLHVPSHYGHFHMEIESNSPEENLEIFDRFCEEWTNKALIKKRLIEFIAWDERNPLEQRRAEFAEYVKDRSKPRKTEPCPASELLILSYESKKSEIFAYILENY